jgi:hypothetical protein
LCQYLMSHAFVSTYIREWGIIICFNGLRTVSKFLATEGQHKASSILMTDISEVTCRPSCYLVLSAVRVH